MSRQLHYVITQCYLPPNASELAACPTSQIRWCSIYLSQMDGRL